MKRRRFLGILLVAAVAAVAGGVGARRNRVRLRRLWRSWYHSSTRLESTPTGPLDEPTARTLLAMTDALLVETPIAANQRTRYEDFFRWHAENVRGYRDLYLRFAAKANRAARRTAGHDFADCDVRVRRGVLDRLIPPRAAEGRWERVRAAVLERERREFRTFVILETLQLFCRTDGILNLGYDAWPGTPRGLEGYRRPPRPRRAS